MQDWNAAAETTQDVFGLPTIAPQGEDGVAHFNYYDRERLLSFQWDGRMGQHITVSHGGYGEPVKWTFDFQEVWQSRRRFRNTGPVVNDPFLDSCLHFKGICDLWVENMEADFEEQNADEA